MSAVRNLKNLDECDIGTLQREADRLEGLRSQLIGTMYPLILEQEIARIRSELRRRHEGARH
jgi:hypothetical protein